jgi:hypothetical protein
VVDEAVAITARFIVDTESRTQVVARELAQLPQRA